MSLTNLLIIGYIIGFFVTYILCKILRTGNPENNRWKDVFLTIQFSVFSWIGFVLILIAWLIFSISKWKENYNPPKWL